MYRSSAARSLDRARQKHTLIGLRDLENVTHLSRLEALTSRRVTKDLFFPPDVVLVKLFTTSADNETARDDREALVAVAASTSP